MDLQVAEFLPGFCMLRISSSLSDVRFEQGVKAVRTKTMTSHSGFKGCKGYDSYSTFQISGLPKLEEHVAWAVMTLLNPFAHMPLSFQLSVGSGRILFCLKAKSKLDAYSPILI